MDSVRHIHKSIVTDLIKAGAASPYSADANEPDPRYKAYGVRRAGRAAIIKSHRKAIKGLNESEKLQLGHLLVESGYGEQQQIGLYVLEQIASYFIPARFAELDGLVRHLHGWSKVDSFCGSLLKEILVAYPDEMIALAARWNQEADMWLRRTSVVLFTRKVAESGRFTTPALQFCDHLKFAPEDLVLKGVGWCLKDLMRADKPRLISYVKQLRAEGVSSVVTLYAIRDLKGAERADVLGK